MHLAYVLWISNAKATLSTDEGGNELREI